MGMDRLNSLTSDIVFIFLHREPTGPFYPLFTSDFFVDGKRRDPVFSPRNFKRIAKWQEYRLIWIFGAILSQRFLVLTRIVATLR
jgi:hypothetical protein